MSALVIAAIIAGIFFAAGVALGVMMIAFLSATERRGAGTDDGNGPDDN